MKNIGILFKDIKKFKKECDASKAYYYNKGNGFYSIGNHEGYEKALKKFDNAIRLDPKNPKIS